MTQKKQTSNPIKNLARHSRAGGNLNNKDVNLKTENINTLITNNLDIWTSAIQSKSRTGRGTNKTYELYGIKKLRALILDLAVRGLLVPQDPNDEPASELLKRIAAEKEQLIKEKKIRNQYSFHEINDKEIPFEIPKLWRFSRFGNVTFNRDGERKPVSQINRKNMQGQFDYYGASGVIDKVNDYLFDKTLLLIGEDGANLISRKTPIAFLAHGKYWVNNHAHVIDGISLEFLKYLALFINSITLEPYITGTAQPKMNQVKMNSIVIAIPPEEEQKRIVTKVDELMVLCDQLEQHTDASIKAHKLLVENLLNALIQAKDHTTFQAAWQRITEHFDTLFTTEHSIDQLKQTILQLAVMGKLVPQDPNDEPACELLKKIATEKQKLIKQGAIKKQKPLPEISEEEKPFELPEGWEFVRFANLAIRMGSGATPRGGKNAYVDKGIPFLRSQNIRNSGLKMFDVAYITDEIHKKMSNTTVYPNDLLLNITGGSLGRSTIFPEMYQEANVSQHVSIIRLLSQVDVRFMHFCILSPHVQEMIWSRQVGVAREGLSKKVMEQFEIPLPPLKEQLRIVSKIDKLRALCDQMKSQIIDSKKTQTKITDSLMVKLFGIQTKTSQKKEAKTEMKILTTLSIGDNQTFNDQSLAAIIKKEGGSADAKLVWSRSKLNLPEFYKQLKKEIEAGYIYKPLKAMTEHI